MRGRVDQGHYWGFCGKAGQGWQCTQLRTGGLGTVTGAGPWPCVHDRWRKEKFGAVDWELAGLYVEVVPLRKLSLSSGISQPWGGGARGRCLCRDYKALNARASRIEKVQLM